MQHRREIFLCQVRRLQICICIQVFCVQYLLWINSARVTFFGLLIGYRVLVIMHTKQPFPIWTDRVLRAVWFIHWSRDHFWSSSLVFESWVDHGPVEFIIFWKLVKHIKIGQIRLFIELLSFIKIIDNMYIFTL